jgi:integrase
MYGRLRANCVGCMGEGAGRRRRVFEGIAVRHQKRCAVGGGGRCSCLPSYQAQVWSRRDGKPIRRTFRSLAEARAWRQESQAAIRRQTLRAPSSLTVEEIAEEWLLAAKAGQVRTRAGRQYKPSALRSYERDLHARVLPEFGQMRLSSVTRNMVQDFADRMVGQGYSPSTVRNAILPLRAMFRRVVDRGEVDLNPTWKLSLPALSPRRERVPRPEEAAALIRGSHV